MAWNTSNRPKISNKLGIPTPREGSDGDIQIRQTNLGAKLFGKLGGRWYDSPFSLEGVSKFGKNSSDHLAINSEEITIFKDGKKVSSFGSDISLFGKIIIGGSGGSFSSNDNITIGQSNSDLGTQNISIGLQAGEVLEGDSQTNVLIGYRAGLLVEAGSINNTCIGSSSGILVTTGSSNTCIGAGANVTATAANQMAIGFSSTAHGANRCTIGNASLTTIDPHSDRGCDLGHTSYEFDNVHCVDATEVSDERLKEDITDTIIGLDFINKLRPVSYKFKDVNEIIEEGVLIQPELSFSRKHQGLIAQEVKLVLDEMNINSSDFGGYVDANINENVDKLALRYRQFIAPLIKAVQELSAKIDTMQEEINILKQA